MCNILYGGFDFVQSAMFFVLSVKYVQYVQCGLSSMCDFGSAMSFLLYVQCAVCVTLTL